MSWHLSIRGLIEYLKDPYQLFAKLNKVSIETYKEFEEWHELTHAEGCKAITKKGEPCKGIARQEFEISRYDPNWTPFCHAHQQQIKKGMKLKTIKSFAQDHPYWIEIHRLDEIDRLKQED